MADKEVKVFNVNWFKPERKGASSALTDKDLEQLAWWCRHYKDGVAYLTWRMMEYFEALDAGEEESAKSLENIIRASLPYYWEEILE